LASFWLGEAFAQTRPDLSAIKTRADWQRAQKQILDGMQLVMGTLPTAKREPVQFQELGQEDLGAFTRTKIKYLTERDDWVMAYLLIPKNRKRRAPAMLCLHQTTRIGKGEPAGLGGSANLHYAKELAERGFVCIAPDYPYLGENTFDPYKNGYVSCTMKGIVNHLRAVDLLQSLPMVDDNRIGSIGHSLGGHNTLFVAAFDQRIKAMVTSCGFTSAKKYYNGDLTGWSGVRYMPLIAEKYGNDANRIPFDFPELLVALAPRPLFINAPLRDSNFEISGVQDCVNAAQPIYEQVFNAKDKLVAVYPDAGHDFPPDVRRKVWNFLDRWLMA
jgi:dienelactone hydrolase